MAAMPLRCGEETWRMEKPSSVCKQFCAAADGAQIPRSDFSPMGKMDSAGGGRLVWKTMRASLGLVSCFAANR